MKHTSVGAWRLSALKNGQFRQTSSGWWEGRSIAYDEFGRSCVAPIRRGILRKSVGTPGPLEYAPAYADAGIRWPLVVWFGDELNQGPAVRLTRRIRAQEKAP